MRTALAAKINAALAAQQQNELTLAIDSVTGQTHVIWYITPQNLYNGTYGKSAVAKGKRCSKHLAQWLVNNIKQLTVAELQPGGFIFSSLTFAQSDRLLVNAGLQPQVLL